MPRRLTVSLSKSDSISQPRRNLRRDNELRVVNMKVVALIAVVDEQPILPRAVGCGQVWSAFHLERGVGSVQVRYLALKDIQVSKLKGRAGGQAGPGDFRVDSNLVRLIRFNNRDFGEHGGELFGIHVENFRMRDPAGKPIAVADLLAECRVERRENQTSQSRRFHSTI